MPSTFQPSAPVASARSSCALHQRRAGSEKKSRCAARPPAFQKLVELALRAVQQSAAEPLFLYVHDNGPHIPYQAPAPYRDLFGAPDLGDPAERPRAPVDAATLATSQRLYAAAVRSTRAESGSFILVNPNTGLLDIEASHGLSERAKRVKLRPGEGITGWVATTGQPLRTGDVREERRYVSINARIRSEMAVPVEMRGQVVGLLNVDSTKVDAFGGQSDMES